MRRFALALLAAAVALMALALPASAKDSNRDRIPDRWEKRYHLSLKVNQARRDQDGDGLKNLSEYRNRTSPRRADTDRDGLNDLREVKSGNDPRDRDSDDDGIEDGSELVGTIESFDPASGALVIAPFAGNPVSGRVTQATEIQCEDEGSDGSSTSDGSNDSGRASSVDGPGDRSTDDNSGDRSTDDGSDDNSSRRVCTTQDLTAGARVKEADLENGVWKKVELYFR